MTKPAQHALRLPPELHEHLKVKADAQGVSTNALMVTYLAGASGFKLETVKPVKRKQ